MEGEIRQGRRRWIDEKWCKGEPVDLSSNCDDKLYEFRDNDFENSEYLSNLPGENGEGVFDGVDAEVEIVFNISEAFYWF